MSQNKIKVAFVGLGSRGNSYADACHMLSDKIEIVACADIIPDKLRRFGDKHGIAPEMRFNSAEELLATGERFADVLFVCTMDKQHYGHAIPALQLGYHLVLEKPASTDPRECAEIARVANENERHVIVCHVMRYTPYLRKVKEIIDSGVLGEIYNITASESVAFWHQAHSFIRGNWRNSDETSPMLLQKCCHDMDMLLWITGKHCKSVSSFGHLSHFKKECAPEGAPERCSKEACPHYDTCPYSIERYLHHGREGRFTWPLDVVTQEGTYEALCEALRTGPYGRCVYYCDNNVVDHQVVNLQFEDELTVSFSMCAFTNGHTGRTMHIMGTKGDLIGNTETGIVVTEFDTPERVYGVEYPEEFDEFGHGGGDFLLVKDMVALFEGEKKDSTTSINDSIESHIICLAAEMSRVNEGQLVKIEDYMKTL